MQTQNIVHTTYIRNAYLENAYLDQDRTILLALVNPLTFPCSPEELQVLDRTTGEGIEVSDIDTAYTYNACVVSDFQHLLGEEDDWYTVDPQTRLTKIHRNLYQLTVTLPKGHYSYKIAFDGGWQHTMPALNAEIEVPADNTAVTFSLVPFDLNTHRTEIYDSINHPEVTLPETSDGMQSNRILIQLGQAPDITHRLSITLAGYRNTLQIVPRHVLDSEAYTYTGNDLGVTLTATTTSFRVWAPTASSVYVLLYQSENGPLTMIEQMQRDQQGTWHLMIERWLGGWHYLYLVTVQGQTQTALDPYARGCSANAHLGLIVDLTQTNPDGWEQDRHRELAAPVDAVIYELHVRDFSIDENSGMVHKGSYLAFTEQGTRGPAEVTTGLDHLKDLGITHVQIMPVSRIATIDETRSNEYNWGYDPANHNIPHGSYASAPEGYARINEFKQLVQSLHRAGIGAIIDVVYNHTYATITSDFDKIVPQYYYRTNEQGYYTNGSGCGNELATERPMVKKFLIDSVHYWISEYHLDGLRFDLMALLGVKAMFELGEDLRALNPDILLYGEPWSAGGSGLPYEQLFTKGQQRGQRIGVFNDDLRSALIGSVFNHGDRGFANGAGGRVDAIKQAVIGSTKTFASEPGEVINYASSHDNLTLWDKISASNGQDSESERIKMDELAQAIVLTSQGIPFIHGGEDFLRTKWGNDNSYNAGDGVNQLLWARKATYHAVFQYYRDLIHLRLAHPAFRLRTVKDIKQQVSFLDAPGNVVAYTLDGKASGDSWKRILVAYSANYGPTTLSLPEGEWTVIGKQGVIDEEGLQKVSGSLELEGLSCTILYLSKESEPKPKKK